MLIGFGKSSIIPEYPVQLVTFKPAISNTVQDPIYAKAVVMRHENEHLTLVTLDLVYCHNEIYDALKQEYNNIIVAATHAHATPALTPSYRTFVIQKIREAIKLAEEDLSPSQLFWGKNDCYLNINRRKRIFAFKNVSRLRLKKTVEVRPNKTGIVDHTLRCVKVVRENAEPIYIINYPCHLTMWHEESISSDWAGKLRLDGHILFLQGFSGDLIPYYEKTKMGIKERIIKLVEGVNDFKKYGTTEDDMQHAAGMVEESIRGMQFVPIRRA